MCVRWGAMFVCTCAGKLHKSARLIAHHSRRNIADYVVSHCAHIAPLHTLAVLLRMHPPQLAGTKPTLGAPVHAMRVASTHMLGCPTRPTRLTNVTPAATPGNDTPPVALRSLEEPVPEDQRPVNELEQLKNSALFSWAMLPPGQYIQRLGLTWAAFVLVIAAPVSFGSFSPSQQPVEFVLASATGGLLAVSVLLLRLYSGYAFVANRLNSATIEYEETGWCVSSQRCMCVLCNSIGMTGRFLSSRQRS